MPINLLLPVMHLVQILQAIDKAMQLPPLRMPASFWALPLHASTPGPGQSMAADSTCLSAPRATAGGTATQATGDGALPGSRDLRILRLQRLGCHVKFPVQIDTDVHGAAAMGQPSLAGRAHVAHAMLGGSNDSGSAAESAANGGKSNASPCGRASASFGRLHDGGRLLSAESLSHGASSAQCGMSGGVQHGSSTFGFTGSAVCGQEQAVPAGQHTASGKRRRSETGGVNPVVSTAGDACGLAEAQGERQPGPR